MGFRVAVEDLYQEFYIIAQGTRFTSITSQNQNVLLVTGSLTDYVDGEQILPDYYHMHEDLERGDLYLVSCIPDSVWLLSTDRPSS